MFGAPQVVTRAISAIHGLMMEQNTAGAGPLGRFLDAMDGARLVVFGVHRFHVCVYVCMY